MLTKEKLLKLICEYQEDINRAKRMVEELEKKYAILQHDIIVGVIDNDYGACGFHQWRLNGMMLEIASWQRRERDASYQKKWCSKLLLGELLLKEEEE